MEHWPFPHTFHFVGTKCLFMQYIKLRIQNKSYKHKPAERKKIMMPNICSTRTIHMNKEMSYVEVHKKIVSRFSHSGGVFHLVKKTVLVLWETISSWGNKMFNFRGKIQKCNKKSIYVGHYYLINHATCGTKMLCTWNKKLRIHDLHYKMMEKTKQYRLIRS